MGVDRHPKGRRLAEEIAGIMVKRGPRTASELFHEQAVTTVPSEVRDVLYNDGRFEVIRRGRPQLWYLKGVTNGAALR